MVNLAAVKIGPVRYNSPWTQITILGIVVFCSVGMFSAIGGLGAGGIQDVQLYAISNAVLYACFCFAGFVAGSVNNLLGPRLTMSLGTVGYSIYVGSLWAHQVHGIRIFLIVAGGFLGITAALLWAAQGSIMMAYPLEKDKGRSFALFWCLFQSGTLVGAAIALGIQYNSTLPTIGTGVYLAFMIIMLTAIVTSWLILPPQYVVRGDGTLVEIEASISPRQEFSEFLKLFKDWRMLALFPMFFSSNYFYAYQGAITAVLFNGRTRALVSLLTGLGSLSGAIILGFLTDRLPFKRRYRALAACLVVLVINCVIWGAGLGFQVQFNRESILAEEELLGAVTPWDFTQSSSAGGPISLLMFYYLGDAAYQGLAYYTMSSLTNDPYKLARMAGYYKGVQSAGAAVSFGMDAVRTPYLAEHLVSWLLLLVSLPLCFLVLYHIRDTNYDVERTTHVEEVDSDKVHGAAMPKGHHAHVRSDVPGEGFERSLSSGNEDKKDAVVQNVASGRG